jgi:TonB C terminal
VSAERPRRRAKKQPFLGDFLPSEVGVAVFFTLCIFTGATIALSASALDRPTEGPAIDKGPSIPVRITPVLVQRVEQKAFVSPKAGKTEQDIPAPDMKVADAGTRPPPPDAGLAKEVDTPIPAPVDAGPAVAANVDPPGSADGVKEGTETDPLKARAVDLYRERIIGWFASKFRVSGSGLSAADLAKYKVGATVQLTADRHVSGYSITPSGNAAFDAAAHAALESAKGGEIPPPPENYPDVVQSTIHLTFVCRENRCD